MTSLMKRSPKPKLCTKNLKRKSLDCALNALKNAKTKEQGNKVRLTWKVFADELEFKESVRLKRIEFNKE